MSDSMRSGSKDSGIEMKKGADTKVLIPVDLSENSLKAVDYVGNVMALNPSAAITILHVIMEPSRDMLPEADKRFEYIERVKAKSLILMKEAGKRLTSRGLPEYCVHLKIGICRNPSSVAELIMREQEEGRYGTIVVGRRGLSKRDEFLFGSVSGTIVRESKGCTVSVVA
ncbi:MAG: universal stress protein [Syntrophobacteraceae bacterium]